MLKRISLVAALLCIHAVAAEVATVRVPDGGIQPQAVMDDKGTMHLIYFKGDAGNGDLFYTTSSDGGKAFSKAIQVNSGAGSAIATGNVRGAHLALGKNNRVHVAWMGSSKAEPKGPNKEAPMLYTRLNDSGSAFDPQRNVITSNYGLDGGGSVAADPKGNVYVTWHGGAMGKGEQYRRVWVARSTDDGKTFAPEFAAYKQDTGACGCCGMNAAADSSGHVYMLYRAAVEKVERGMVLLTSRDGTNYDAQKLDEWKLNTCPMSTANFNSTKSETLIAWENNGQVYFGRIGADGKSSTPIAAPGDAKGRKHPTVAENAAGEILLAWTEGMGWQRGGKLHYQVFDKSGKPTATRGGQPGVPAWSLVSANATADGKFVVLY